MRKWQEVSAVETLLVFSEELSGVSLTGLTIPLTEGYAATKSYPNWKSLITLYNKVPLVFLWMGNQLSLNSDQKQACFLVISVHGKIL